MLHGRKNLEKILKLLVLPVVSPIPTFYPHSSPLVSPKLLSPSFYNMYPLKSTCC